jgi:hypothetical protein
VFDIRVVQVPGACEAYSEFFRRSLRKESASGKQRLFRPAFDNSFTSLLRCFGNFHCPLVLDCGDAWNEPSAKLLLLMKRSISIRVVTVLFAGSLFGAYVVYSQLARNPQAATSRQSQERAITGRSTATNVPTRNPDMVAPGSKSRAPLISIQPGPHSTGATSTLYSLSPVIASSSKSARVIDPELSRRLFPSNFFAAGTNTLKPQIVVVPITNSFTTEGNSQKLEPSQQSAIKKKQLIH